MTVYFLRHASAGERKKDLGKDIKRGLDRAGIDQASSMGRVLAGLEVHMDAIVTSPLKRAAQTATLVANEMGFDGKLQISPALAPGATYSAFQRLLSHYSGFDVILLVGHKPNLMHFLGRLIGGSARPARIAMPKGGLAKVELVRSGAALEWLLTPKTVKSVER